MAAVSPSTMERVAASGRVERSEGVVVIEHEADPSLDSAHALSTGSLRCARCVARLPAGRDGRSDKRRYCSGRCRAAASREAQAARVRRMEALIGELAKLTHEIEK
jgi:hypothetical protein